MGSVGAFAPLGVSVFGCDVSYAQLCAFPAVAGSFQTRQFPLFALLTPAPGRYHHTLSGICVLPNGYRNGCRHPDLAINC